LISCLVARSAAFCSTDLNRKDRPRVSLPELHLSKPGVHLPSVRVDNAETIRRVRAVFKGTDDEFAPIAAGIEHVLGMCRTRVRYIEPDPMRPGILADYAVAAAKQCLEVNGVALDEVDLVIGGGIARQYFEPATAMEVAAKLGLKRTHAFDVTAACVGHLEALQTAAGYLTMHDSYRTALVFTSELSGQFLSYDIQSVRDLAIKTAGLTIGNAAACMLLRKKPFPGGGIKLKAINTFTAPDHWDLCRVPIDGTLVSSSVELMRLGKYIPPWVKERLGTLGLEPGDIDYYLFHQPSEVMVRKILADIGVDPERGIYTHALYGNTASASVGVTYRQLLQDRPVKIGDKIVLGSAAAGYSMVMATGEWSGQTT
jgi:3-oxoacyl-[acyl-carrier-protein] synthase-3